MLGIVHRAALRKGPPHLWRFFTHAPPLTHNYPTRRTRHSRHLNDNYRNERHTDTLLHSACGLIGVYNLLPEYVARQATVSEFQSSLQQLVKECAARNNDQWTSLLSPRHHLTHHPLTRL